MICTTVLLYIYVQAREDSLTGYVDATLNAAAVALSSAAAIASAFAKGIGILDVADAVVLFALLAVVTMETKRGPVMQVGDAKAIWTVYASSCAAFSQSAAFYIACATVVLANVAYIAYRKAFGIKKQRAAYFPALAAGYSISSAVSLAFFSL